MIKPNNLFVICLSFSMMAAVSCELFNNDRDVVANKKSVYDGIYIQGIEDSWFKPCNISNESWKPVFTKTTFDDVYKVLSEHHSGKIYIRARGIPSEIGEYKGWFARYDRKFEIKEIVKLYSSKSDKCP